MTTTPAAYSRRVDCDKISADPFTCTAGTASYLHSRTLNIQAHHSQTFQPYQSENKRHTTQPETLFHCESQVFVIIFTCAALSRNISFTYNVHQLLNLSYADARCANVKTVNLFPTTKKKPRFPSKIMQPRNAPKMSSTLLLLYFRCDGFSPPRRVGKGSNGIE